MSMLMSALAGANMIYGLGMIDLGMTLDFAQLVVDNEIAKMVRNVIGGIPVTDETIALDVIHSVGAGGHFLMEDHTLERMRSVKSYTDLFDRQPYDGWTRAGKKDLAARALEETKRILATHKAIPLKKDVSSKLRDIVLSAADEFKVKVDLP